MSNTGYIYPEINILVPGRHHLTTVYREHYLKKLIQKDLCDSLSVTGSPLNFPSGIKAKNLIFPITSANHSGTRRNPLTYTQRAILLDRFGQHLKSSSQIQSFPYPIDDIPYSQHFADYLLKKIEIESRGRFTLTPENTVVMSSTPGVIKQFQNLGYQILPAELKPGTLDTPEYLAERPRELVEYLVGLEGAKNTSYRNVDEKVLDDISEHTRELYKEYQLVPYIHDLFMDGLLGSDGDLTTTRDYREYLKSFDDGAERKYEQIKEYLYSGKIVDIGCCSGSLIEKMTKDSTLQDADFYGIEVARILYDECIKRKESGQYFNSNNVFFLQKNIAEKQAFKDNSIDIFTSFSLTHEVYSYQSKQALEKMIALLTKQLKLGGRWINVDVVGPENGDNIVLAAFSTTDGGESYPEPTGELKHRDYTTYKIALQKYLDSLSTYERFLRFAQDFRKVEGDQISYEVIEKEGKSYIQAPYKSICEFMSKKEYTGNRESEMHERFCDFAFSDWKTMLEKAGLTVHPESKAYTNPWLVDHVRKNNVEIFEEENDTYGKSKLVALDYPPTTIQLIAEKK